MRSRSLTSPEFVAKRKVSSKSTVILAHRMAEMEKRRIGTRFLDREVTEADKEKPLIVKIQESCKVM